MKLLKSLFLVSALFAISACNTQQGAKLTVENASTYLEPLKENVGNANFDASTISFNIYPSQEAGKLFSSDIKGKCNLTYKYATGLLNWSEPVEVKDVAFAYKEGGKDESGEERLDSLFGSFSYQSEEKPGVVNVYNIVITEISGHMKP